MLNLDPIDYPSLKDVIINLQEWDKRVIKSSKGAAVFLLLYYYL